MTAERPALAGRATVHRAPPHRDGRPNLPGAVTHPTLPGERHRPRCSVGGNFQKRHRAAPDVRSQKRQRQTYVVRIHPAPWRPFARHRCGDLQGRSSWHGPIPRDQTPRPRPQPPDRPLLQLSLARGNCAGISPSGSGWRPTRSPCAKPTLIASRRDVGACAGRRLHGVRQRNDRADSQRSPGFRVSSTSAIAPASAAGRRPPRPSSRRRAARRRVRRGPGPADCRSSRRPRGRRPSRRPRAGSGRRRRDPSRGHAARPARHRREPSATRATRRARDGIRSIRSKSDGRSPDARAPTGRSSASGR